MTLFNRIGIAAKAIVSQTPSKAAQPQKRPPPIIQDSYTERDRSAAISLGAGRALYCPSAGGSPFEHRAAMVKCIGEQMSYHAGRLNHICRLQAFLERCDDPKIETEIAIPQIMMVYGEMVDQKLIDDRRQGREGEKTSYLMALKLLSAMKQAYVARLKALGARLQSIRGRGPAERYLLDLPSGDGTNDLIDLSLRSYIKSLPSDEQSLMRHLKTLPPSK